MRSGADRVNVITRTASGALVLTAHEAEMRIDQLWRKVNLCLSDAQRDTAAAARYMREINALIPVAHPERAYETNRYEGPV